MVIRKRSAGTVETGTVVRAGNGPMQLEVPRDQYAGAVETMRNKIREGKVREAGAHNVLVTSAVNNNGVTELFALLHTEEGCC